MRIVVLAGGLSPERDVSLSSGSLIANALMENGHEVALVDLYRGTDVVGNMRALFFNGESGKRFEYNVPAEEPDLKALALETDNDGALIGKNVLELCKFADVAFIALHGSIGENGQLQAVFDTFGIKYTGTGYAGSLLAMDKDISKRLMARGGVLTPEWVMYDTENGDYETALSQIGLPCVVKPCGCGSSVGVSIINERAEMEKALTYAKKYERHVLIEKMVKGREFSVGVLGGKALPVIEITPNEGFYDYANKYQPGFATETCPAEIPDDTVRMMQASALKAHETLKLGFYSRIDFLLDAENRCWCLEANTLPGMTPTSLLPQEAKAAGISYNELCEKIAQAAV